MKIPTEVLWACKDTESAAEVLRKAVSDETEQLEKAIADALNKFSTTIKAAYAKAGEKADIDIIAPNYTPEEFDGFVVEAMTGMQDAVDAFHVHLLNIRKDSEIEERVIERLT